MSPPNRSRHTHTLLALHESSCFGTNRSSATPSGGGLSHPFPDHTIEYSAFTAIYRRLQLKISPPSPTANYERGQPRDPLATGLTASRSPGPSAGSMKAGGLARDKVRNARWKVRCRLLSSCPENPSATSITKRGPEKYRDVRSPTAKNCHSGSAWDRSESDSKLMYNPFSLRVVR